MKFTPQSIKNQQFNKSVRGYDKEEVEAFLENLSDEFEQLIYENETFKKEFDEMNAKLEEYKKIEKNLQHTLLTATESSTKAVDSAKRQTQLMIKEAELKASQIIDKASQQSEAIKKSVIELREERKLLIARLRAMIESQATLLAFNIENIESKPIKSKEVKPVANASSKINVNDILEKLL